MSLIKVNKNKNPYHIIGEYIEKHITYVDDIIAVISLDGNIINELFLVEITTESNFIWQNDWWEGEENVELVDFFFVSDACKKCDNNDLISRQSAVDELVKMLSDCFYADEEVLDAVETTLKELPSAQPERKRGKWIPVTRIEEWSKEEGFTGFPPEVAEFPNCTIKYVDATEPDEVDAVKCSECGTVFDFTDARNWCSECGADMRGEQDG